jgi:L-glutamine-phosphate cytidylyltransferase
MTGIILAAGKGSRIAEMTGGLPKSFLKVGGTRIFDHQVAILKRAHISNIIAVVGYRADLFLEEYKDAGITFIRNPFYNVTNVLGSLWFARDQMLDGFYFMHADTYFDPTILFDLAKSKNGMTLCVETKSTREEEMKVVIEGGLIRRISKLLDCNTADGEFTGLARVDESAARQVVSAVRHRIEVLGDCGAFFEAAVQDLIDKGLAVHPMDIGNRTSIEIDFPEDYEAAVQRVGQIALG